MIDVRIEQWRAWAPGLDNEDAWRAWAEAPHKLPDNGEQPNCDFLPAMQRRRLSRLARMTLEAAWPLCDEQEQLPLVFASRHGESPRTYALLSDLVAEEPLSPTQFGLSVHNAIAGQWSMLRGQRGESVAIAGEADTFEHAMLEAAMLLTEGAPAVIVVIAEERPAQAYEPWIHDVPFSYALALRLGGSAGRHWQLRLERNTGDTHAGDPSIGAWPHALDFLRALHTGSASLEHIWKTRRWIWQPLP
ncbi:beta-ketoacyl synthase chain length factor [Dyella tabacisoli]|uniref:3-oxoacyl-ACP synthase n=1 Tax=Dyella tabacisoli TaxID=2282381 RepID=A0A369UTP6_9GAMM|nr:beta-ketoacyl synthase chain length factor [Dyella tabacisoli]RDD81709.1 3-oxoacyl-ACP synthase [Dyella tabacisoli]